MAKPGNSIIPSFFSKAIKSLLSSNRVPTDLNKQSIDFERKLELFYTAYLAEGEFVVDIGAHSGRHTKQMANTLGADGRVWAFEPNPAALRKLEEHVDREIQQGIVRIFPFAISKVNGTSSFVIANQRPEESGLRQRIYNGPTTVTQIEVEVKTLDSLLLDTNLAPSFLKIDIEGAEYDALCGAKQILEKFNPVIAFEFGENSCTAYNVQPGDVYDFLHAKGYSIFTILGELLDKAHFIESSRVQKVWDYVACPEDKMQKVEQALSQANNQY